MNFNHYQLLETREIPELHLTGYLFSHIRTGARVLYLHAPEDNNKVFSISFATPPENDCGIPHILEHCTLNGSDKYPVKEPFVDLLKGSLNTFLNAMTFPDKTMFPVASRNEQDFMNLMSVYLDAVFYPKLREDPFIFRQEGWHYELTDRDAELTYKGVVYNEMKGAYSSGDTVLEYLVNRSMFPDSPYGFESGGHPDAIPSLSYEEFRAFHEKNYHPCNSFIFFYGDGPMEEHLAFLDEEYLSHFEEPSDDMIAKFPLQKPFEHPIEADGTYAVGREEDTKNKTYLSYNVMLKPVTTAKDYFMLDSLSELLCMSEASPLKIALLKEGIGQDISCRIDVSMQQPKLSVIAKNADADQKDRFLSVIRSVFADIAENGFDSRLIDATLSQNLFSMREANYGSAPRGLLYGIQCMDFWLYGLDPMDLLAFEEPMASIKADPGCFAAYIRDEVMENPHTVVAVLRPEQDLNSRIEIQTKEQLKVYKDSLNEDEISTLVKNTREMLRRQQEPDRPEDLAKLPMLKREDLEPIKPFKTAEELKIAGADASVFCDNASRIIYMTLEFDMSRVPEEMIPYASFLSDVLSNVNTEKYSYMDLDNEIGCHMGGMSVHTTLLQRMDGSIKPCFNVDAKFLAEETEAALNLIHEILLHSDFSETDRVLEILDEEIAGMEDEMSSAGNRTAAARAFSYFDPYYAYNEKLGGIDFYRFVKKLRSRLENGTEDLKGRMDEILHSLIGADNLRIRLTLDEDNAAETEKLLGSFVSELPPASKKGNTVQVLPVCRNEGLIFPGKVQYVVKAGKTSLPYTGTSMVLSHMARLDYLWNHVRVMGGAYGSSCSIDRMGRVCMTSYRDPNLKKTLEIYEKAGREIAETEISDEEMLKYIIGTISGLDPVMTVSMRGKLAHDALETGMPNDRMTKLSEEVLAVDQNRVHAAAEAFTEAMKCPYVCVIGSENTIRENASLFNTVENLFD